MKEIRTIIKVLTCTLAAVIMLAGAGCSHEDKQTQANANAMFARTVVLQVFDSLYQQQGTLPSGCIIKGHDYNIEIGDRSFSKAYLEQYLGSDWNGYVFGEFNEKTGSIEYILWSEDPIPSKYKTLLTAGDQELAANEGVIIGCYPQYY